MSVQHPAGQRPAPGGALHAHAHCSFPPRLPGPDEALRHELPRGDPPP
ncbi:hypothetical protein [Streptomyces sp. NRRL S-1868]|nr:hypothetical protein [Streptomyces sp. NRRL S-1868]